MLGFHRSISISAIHAAALFLVFLVAGVVAVVLVNRSLKEDALHTAREKAQLLLEHNLAIHTYFNRDLKPAVFRMSDRYRDSAYFDPVWMSSTYAVRSIDKYSRQASDWSYYYKESADNARSPENEADAFEQDFIRELNVNAELMERAGVRVLDGKHYFVVLRRGESMEDSCMLCHSVPRAAPKGLVDVYGPSRSFQRTPGEVVSAVSIRISLEEAYEKARLVSTILSIALLGILAVVYALQFAISRKLIYLPLAQLRDKALQISMDEQKLGQTIDMPKGRELRAVTESFNRMSTQLRDGRDHLEDIVRQRTAQLQSALDNVKTLSGMLPICAHCKKVRDDDGYWNQIESYLRSHSDAQFTHGICPECAVQYYPSIFRKKTGSGEDPESRG